MTPYGFIVVLWGDRFRDYFLDFCVASLLAPRNLPALPNGNHRFLIVCPDSDWTWIVSSLAFHRLSRYVEVEHIQFDAPNPTDNPCKAMSRGHLLAVKEASRLGLRGVHLTPDMVWSDGLLETVHQKSEQGAAVVLTAALRFDEHRMIVGMMAHGWHIGELPLALSARQLVAVGMQAMHPETLSYQWGHPLMAANPAACWTPADEGMVCCSFSWAPLLFDYSRLSQVDVSTLEHWTMDGDYVYRNFPDRDAVAVLRDSDEGLLLSWSPVESETYDVPDYHGRLMTAGQCKSFGKWYNSKALDPLKRRLFWEPVSWHPGPLTNGYSIRALDLLDAVGHALHFDWRRQVFYDAAGEPVATLDETKDAYETRCRNGR